MTVATTIVLAVGLAGLGAAAGVVSTIAGGASVLTTPALILLGLSPMEATATGFAALSPSAFAAIWTDRRRLPATTAGLRLVYTLSFLGALGGGGALLLTGEAAYRQLVPALLGAATALFWIAPRVRRLRLGAGDERLARLSPGLAAGFLAGGVYSSFFGTGYGVVLLALLRIGGVSDYASANRMKNIAGCCSSVAALAFFTSAHLIAWPTALALGAGNVAGGVAGAHLARRAPAQALRRAILIAGAASTVALAWRFWF
jgi:hypothetical protein